MTHSQVPDREAVARFACLDAGYKGVQDPHLEMLKPNNPNGSSQLNETQPCHSDMDLSISNLCKIWGKFYSKSKEVSVAFEFTSCIRMTERGMLQMRKMQTIDKSIVNCVLKRGRLKVGQSESESV